MSASSSRRPWRFATFSRGWIAILELFAKAAVSQE
jgi:hypothetical protein